MEYRLCSNYLSLGIQTTPSLKSRKLAGSSHPLIRSGTDCMSWHLLRGRGLALVTSSGSTRARHRGYTCRQQARWKVKGMSWKKT